nr:hypothetical protein HmN_000061100 [Hymenolepis microstoma]
MIYERDSYGSSADEAHAMTSNFLDVSMIVSSFLQCLKELCCNTFILITRILADLIQVLQSLHTSMESKKISKWHQAAKVPPHRKSIQCSKLQYVDVVETVHGLSPEVIQ